MKSHYKVGVLFVVLFLIVPLGVEGKVVFTGYSDVHFEPYGKSEISGSDALLNSLDVDEESRERSFELSSVGLFATTQLGQGFSFNTDITFKEIAEDVGDLRLQYAYARYAGEHATLRAGKIDLPIGYFNQHKFYPFERKAISSPVFQGSILGLPISDVGLELSGEMSTGLFPVTWSVYGVNGFGNADSADTVFRPGVGANSALVIRDNIEPESTNDKLSWGSRLGVELLPGEDQSLKFGGSYYGGPWSPDGEDDFQLWNSHLYFEMARFEFLGEYLHTETENDQGVVATLGSPDWQSDGVFIESNVRIYRADNTKLYVFAGGEHSEIEGTGAGASMVEELDKYKAGLTLDYSRSLTLKAELSRLNYDLPFQAFNERLGLEDDEFLFSGVVTF